MKKVLLTGSALVAALSIASAAHAADVAPPAAYDWTGFYIGANAGVSWNNSSVDNDFYINDTRVNDIENKIDGSQAAFTGGGIVGYNYQIDQIVLGVEADFNYLGFGDSGKRSGSLVIDNHPTVDLTAKGSVDANWFGTIRARLGYAVDSFLIYGTAGAAYGHVNANGSVTASSGGTELVKLSDSYDSTNWGWTVGGGVEYGIDDWSLGVEYLYVDLGDGNYGDRDVSIPGHDLKLGGDADYAFSTVRATVKYHFPQ